MFKDWQNQYHSYIINKNINNIIVPGTHDSAAYFLSPEYDTSFFKKIGANIDLAERWTLCQDDSIFTQLIKGVRHLDIRLTKENNEYYVSHTFICDTFKSVVDQIYDFICICPREFIFIFLDPDKRGNFDPIYDMEAIGEILKNKFGDKCVLSINITNNIDTGEYIRFPKYKDILKDNKQLFFYTRKDRQFINPWIDVSSTNEKFDYLLNQYENFNKDKHNTLSFTITPQVGDIIKSAIIPCESKYSDLKTLSIGIKNRFIDFIEEKRKNVSCYMMDYITLQNCSDIISLNLDVKIV